MDMMTKYIYELKFRTTFLEKKGNEYQDWFSDIMEMRYPSDFMRIRPWGNVGDQKNDGYLPSKRMLFQVYAPNDMKENATLRKIDEDYKGAKKYWKKYFDTWVFTHNSKEGVSPRVSKKILELQQQKPPYVIHWGYNELYSEVFQLNLDDLQRLFGLVPTVEDIQNIQIDNFINVLDHVASKAPQNDIDMRPVPFGKLDANGLSQEAQFLIQIGQRKSNYVGKFFRQWHDPTYGDEVSSAFKQEYIRLKNEGLVPDDIFSKLLIFIGINKVTLPKDTSAVYALIAYFFDACDIFERPIET